MAHMKLHLLLSVVSIGFGVITSEHGAQACATLGKAPVKIEHEEAIIVWDDAKKIEHFIRRVEFKTNGSDLGFLVPVPAKPEVAEADSKAFERLAAVVGPPMLTATAPNSRTAVAAGVKVLEEKRVAGMDMAVLEADTAASLAKWLNDHGYSKRPALDKWLESYVRAHFKLVAFKYSGHGTGDGVVATKAVRISFAAPYPYYPYKEPSDAEAPPMRSLTLYLFAPLKAHGFVFTGTGTGKVEWVAKVTHAAEANNAAELLAGAVPLGGLPSGLWLTAFEDKTVKRPDGAELFFEKAN